MYAINIVNLGNLGLTVPWGKHGTLKLKNKTRRGWINETRSFYIYGDYTVIVNDFPPNLTDTQLAYYADKNAITKLSASDYIRGCKS